MYRSAPASVMKQIRNGNSTVGTRKTGSGEQWPGKEKTTGSGARLTIGVAAFSMLFLLIST
ncbi:MAG TPA: hypothetical protein VFT51_15860 [Bacillales bacterium]|nr:hypothetical protein [Bacillales bacterium]